MEAVQSYSCLRSPRTTFKPFPNHTLLPLVGVYAESRSGFLNDKFHKYKRRVVLRRDAVEDDPRSFAVLTEQGSSASHMAAARIPYIYIYIAIARMRRQCQRRCVSTKVKMQDAAQWL